MNPRFGGPFGSLVNQVLPYFSQEGALREIGNRDRASLGDARKRWGKKQGLLSRFGDTFSGLMQNDEFLGFLDQQQQRRQQQGGSLFNAVLSRGLPQYTPQATPIYQGGMR